MNIFVDGNPKETEVAIQDQHTPIFQYYLMTEERTNILLTSPFVIGESKIEVGAGHSITNSNWLCLWKSNIYMQTKVMSVVGNSIYLDRPSLHNWGVAETQVVKGMVDMNVDGSSTPVEYKMRILSGDIPIDVTRVHICMIHPAEADDSKFGGITALTNGLFLYLLNHRNFEIGLFTDNHSFVELGGERTYTSKAGGGAFGTDVALKYAGQAERGVALRIFPETDYFIGVVRDNLSTLTSLRISVIGHYTEGE